MIESIARPCSVCGREFQPSYHLRAYCSVDCRQLHDYPPRRPRPPRPPAAPASSIGSGLGLSTGTVGALGELMVATDLIRRGYHVFRALSPSAPCDLVAYRAGEAPLKIEVKTGYVRRDGEVSCGPLKNPHDVLAMVLGDGRIVYRPPL